MKQYLRLYIKEIAFYRFVFVALLLAYFYMYTLMNPRSIFYIQFMIIFVFGPAALLVYSFQNEWETGSHFTLLSIPVRRYTIILAKFLATVTLCLVILAGTSALSQTSHFNYAMRYFLETNTFFKSSWRFEHFSFSVMLLGAVCLTESIQFTVKSYRRFLWFGVFILCTGGVLLFHAHITPQVDKSFTIIVSNLAFGLIYLCAGMVVFEKYGDI